MKKISAVLLTVFISVSFFYSNSSAEPAYTTTGSIFRLDGGAEYNAWIPYKSSYLDYTIQGIVVGYLDAALFPGIRFLPSLSFHYETNFNTPNQKELMAAQQAGTDLEQAYNKMRFIGSFFQNSEGRNTLEVEYTKETFFISVTPNVPNLYYAPYNSEGKIQFSEGDEISQFTKFQEINATFDTYGVEILIGLMNALTTGEDMEIRDLSDIFDTRLGLFYAEFYKPYETSMVVGGSGTTTGETNTIYNARFRTVGLIEKIQTRPSGMLVFSYLPRFGISFINLQKGVELQDAETPLFFYYGHEFELGLRLGSDNFAGKIAASVDFSFMYGGELKTNSETNNAQIDTKSFINNDVLIKVYGVFEFSI